MVELKYYPGIVELPRRHKWKQGVMLDQSHQVPESRVIHQRRNVVVRLSMELSTVELYIPRDKVPEE